MPQLPQISPEPVSVGFQTGRVPRNPVPGAVGNLAKSTNEMIQDLGDLFMKQHQAIQDKKAFNDFFAGHTKLEEDVTSEHDPVKRLAAYKNGLNYLQSTVREKYPQMSESMQLEIARYMDKGLYRQIIDTHHDTEKINKIDAKSVDLNTMDNLKVARTKEDRAMLLEQYNDHLEQMANTGVIQRSEIPHLAFKMGYFANKSAFDELAENPKSAPAALLMTEDQTGLSPEDHNAGHIKALSTIDRGYKEVEVTAVERKTARTRAVTTGQVTDPTTLMQWRKERDISEPTYEYAVKGVKSNPQVRDALFMDFGNQEFISKEQIDAWVHHNIDVRQDISTSDKKEVLDKVQELKFSVGNTQTQHANSAYFDVVNSVRHEMSKDMRFQMGGKYQLPEYREIQRQVGSRLSQLKKELDKEKAIPEQSERASKAKKEIMDILGNKKEEESMPIPTGEVDKDAEDFIKSLGSGE